MAKDKQPRKDDPKNPPVGKRRTREEAKESREEAKRIVEEMKGPYVPPGENPEDWDFS